MFRFAFFVSFRSFRFVSKNVSFCFVSQLVSFRFLSFRHVFRAVSMRAFRKVLRLVWFGLVFFSKIVCVVLCVVFISFVPCFFFLVSFRFDSF